MSAGVLTALSVLGLAGALALGDAGRPVGRAGGVGPTAEQPANVWTAATVLPGPGSSPAGTASPGTPSGGAPATVPPVAGRGSASPSGTSAAVTGELPAADRLAGLTTTRLVQVGTGNLVVVPGSVPAPRPAAPRMTVRVEVEQGIGVDGPAFAAFVMDTLNDPRGWGHDGTLSFARTSGAADIRVILASPDTSEQLCAPALTHGTMSCGGGDRAVLTMYRWMNGLPDYGNDRTGYRQYMINHEIGHVLGHSHGYCDPGHLAPVMVQQTKGLHGCLPNPWPFPTR